MKRFLILALMLASLALAAPAHATTITIASAAEWVSKAPTLKPGDEAVFADGTYNTPLLSATIQPQGTAAMPITLRAATPGKVSFTQSMDVGGAPKGDLAKCKPLHLIIRGIDFSNSRSTLSEFSYFTLDNCGFQGVGSGNVCALTVQWCKNITLRDCAFANVGGTRYALLVTHSDVTWAERLLVFHDKTMTDQPAMPIALYSTANATVKDVFISGNCDGTTGERHAGVGIICNEGPCDRITIDGLYLKNHGNAECLNALVSSAASISNVTIKNIRADNVRGLSCVWSKTSALSIDNVILRGAPAKFWGDQAGTVTGLKTVATNPFEGLSIPFEPAIEARLLAFLRQHQPGAFGTKTLAEFLGLPAPQPSTTQPAPVEIPLTAAAAQAVGDANTDGVVDIQDLGIVSNHYNWVYNKFTGKYELKVQP